MSEKLFAWRLVSEERPSEESLMALCWRNDWDMPHELRWKTNDRIVDARKRATAAGVEFGDLQDSYFGDPVEWDDYESSRPINWPTHWVPLSELSPNEPPNG